MTFARPSVAPTPTKRDEPMTTTATPLPTQDQDEIRELLVDYAFGLDDRDFDRVAAMFTDNAQISTVFDQYLPHAAEFSGATTGGAALVAGVAASFQRLDATQHLLGATTMVAVADGVHARTQFVAHHHKGEAYFHTGGTYDDLLVRTPGGWRLARRTLRISWTTGDAQVMLGA